MSIVDRAGRAYECGILTHSTGFRRNITSDAAFILHQPTSTMDSLLAVDESSSPPQYFALLVGSRLVVFAAPRHSWSS